MKPEIGISDNHSQKVSEQLSKLLADETVLYIKTKNAHWNVEDASFYEKHIFFETQIVQLDEVADDIAERIRAIGHFAPASLKAYLDLTHLTEVSDERNDGQGFIKTLLNDHESIIISLRKNIKPFASEFQDLGTSDFITGLMEKHEKMAWLLRSHLKN